MWLCIDGWSSTFPPTAVEQRLGHSGSVVVTPAGSASTDLEGAAAAVAGALERSGRTVTLDAAKTVEDDAALARERAAAAGVERVIVVRVFDEGGELSGESWDGQRIIVSWADVEAALDGDPVNVVAHECAHQLDDEAPQAEGAPLLADYDEWSRIMQAEYDRLCEHGSPVIDDYGCESPAEFFAVCVESYLQRGAELAHHHPALYGLLCSHFQLNTAHLDEH